MIILIHGDDTAASRNFYFDTKKLATSPVTVEADKTTLTEIVQIITGGNLFGDDKTVFIESLLTKKKKSAELTAILTELKNSDLPIYLWEGKEIDKRTVTSLQPSKSHIFKLPESLFQFMDALSHKNPRLLPLFHENLKTLEPEFLFSMIIRQVRLLIAIQSSGEEIDELKRMAWQRGKLLKQSKSFPPGALKKHFRKLYEIDLAQKTGTLPVPLNAAIDIWLLEL